MDWMNQLTNVLGRYANQPGAQPTNPQNYAQQGYGPVDDDYDQVVQHAPPQAISQGLAGAFRSPDTPPFGTMTAQMFGQANPQQRADLLNTLLQAAGPAVLSQLANRGAMTGGQGGGALGNLGGLLGMLGGGSALGGLLGGGQQPMGGQPGQIPPQVPFVTPEQAAQIPPQAVEELATHAEHQNPSIVDQISDFYAQQPALVKGLGAAALITVLAKMAQSR